MILTPEEKFWYMQRNRDTVLHHYGAICNYCNETNYRKLVIQFKLDKDRKRIGTGKTLVRWLIRKHFPSIVLILCRKCNIKHLNGKYSAQ